MFLFLVNAFNLEDDRPCAVGATADHFVLTLHPTLHDGTTLQTCIDVPRNGIPSL